ncbi:AMP-binding protein [Maritimibacter alkaliphilus]|uniref:AMP-binding protein n=1 Tax=Maritimibacter alkaliphilus TaxID=404236 RepID=UPI001C974223|nr:AMP-binding protein [Maritimibacter alkaliphilus]MBY6090597.1 AMP-binding protein [Maritimibacter alkaliphilus]
MTDLFTALAESPNRPLLTGPDEFYLDGAAMLALRETLEEGLAGMGLGPTSVVAARLGDGPAQTAVLFALAHLVRLVPLNPALQREDLAHQLSISGAQALINEAALGPAPVAGDVPQIRLELPEAHAPQSLTLTGAAVAPGESWSEGPGLVLFTSGSTGLPKAVPLTLENLYGAAERIGGSLYLGPEDMALHALPMFHIGGFVDLMLAPLIAGGAVHCASGRDPSAILQAARESGATWLQAVPTMLARMEAEYSADDWAELGGQIRLIRSVSADLPETRQAMIEDLLGGEVPILPMYGMTETCGLIATTPLPPSPRKAGSVGVIEGCALRICAPDGSDIEEGATGQVRVMSPDMMTGYLGEAESPFDADGWLITGDLGHIDEEGYLYLDGREKEMINRGGEKISPQEIERAILSHHAIIEAAAYARPHPTLGEHVGLAVVLRPGRVAGAEELRKHLALRLADFKRPGRIDIKDALPRLAGGKLDRVALAALSDEEAADRAPLSDTAQKIAEAWEQVLHRKPEGLAADFFEAGGDSLSATQFVFEVTRLTGVKLDPAQLYDTPTFGAFATMVETQDKAETARLDDAALSFVCERVKEWKLSPARPDVTDLIFRVGGQNGPRPLFWCVQADSEWPNIVEALGKKRPIYAMRTLFQMVGKDDAQSRRLAYHYATAIDRLQREGPIALGGFCEGAKVMTWVAEELAARGREVSLLVNWDHWPDAPTAFPTLHVWTEDKTHSARHRMVGPERALPLMHPAGAEGHYLQGRHGQTLRAPLPETLAKRLNALIDGQENLPVTEPGKDAFDTTRPATAEAYKAEVKLRAPRFARRRAAVPVKVTVTNTSTVTWPAGQTCVILTQHNFDGHIRARIAGSAALEQDLAPGESVTREVQMTYPDKFVPVRVTADVIDNGVAFYSDYGLDSPRRTVWPFSLRRS